MTNMTKAEAIEQMKSGSRLTHKYFGPDEWVTSTPDGRTYILEDGVECSSEEFWHWRTDDYWNQDWSIVD